MKNFSNIVSEEIRKVIGEKCMIKEYKNPNDAEIVRGCGDTLEQMYNRIIDNGCSRHEITVELLAKVVKEIRYLEQIMK
jgi:hypothetical protein